MIRIKLLISLLLILTTNTSFGESALEAIYGYGEKGFQHCLEQNYEALGEDGAIDHCTKLEGQQVDEEVSKENLGGKYFETTIENDTSNKLANTLLLFSQYNINVNSFMDFYTNPKNQFKIASAGVLITYALVNRTLRILSRGKLQIPLKTLILAIGTTTLANGASAHTIIAPGEEYGYFDIEVTLKKLGEIQRDKLEKKEIVLRIVNTLSLAEQEYLLRVMSDIELQLHEQMLKECSNNPPCDFI